MNNSQLHLVESKNGTGLECVDVYENFAYKVTIHNHGLSITKITINNKFDLCTTINVTPNLQTENDFDIKFVVNSCSEMSLMDIKTMSELLQYVEPTVKQLKKMIEFTNKWN